MKRHLYQGNHTSNSKKNEAVEITTLETLDYVAEGTVMEKYLGEAFNWRSLSLFLACVRLMKWINIQ